eukprot:gb/GECG01003730.1/.p1 GENE.gb/GECG01003730.1/~~gb/GECG01003730.1/.p1  ORF type:complete len:146 (+),score=21.22 gb/GECG01003730.1/:1-438(+)
MGSENMASREMRGGGFYTKATKGCFDVIANAKDMVMEQMEKATIPEGKEPFTIMDLGTADGGTVMYLMKDILDKLRSRDPSKEAVIIYEDQPTNDFKPLFLMTQLSHFPAEKSLEIAEFTRYLLPNAGHDGRPRKLLETSQRSLR